MTHADKNPATAKFLTCKCEFELAFAQSVVGIGTAFRRPEAPVPQHHGAAPVLSFRNCALKISIVERVVLHLDREALICRVERRSLCHRPGLEHAVRFESEVVVKPGGSVFLDHEAWILRRLDPSGTRRLPRLCEIAFGAIGVKLGLYQCLCTFILGRHSQRRMGTSVPLGLPLEQNNRPTVLPRPPGDRYGPPTRLLERISQALTCYLPGRTLSSLERVRKNPLSSDQSEDGKSSPSADGSREDGSGGRRG